MAGERDRLILGVGADATPDELARAYRLRALETHPDLAGGSAPAFKQVRAAYVALVGGARSGPASAGPASGPRLEPAIVDFGTSRPGDLVWRSVVVWGQGREGGRLRVAPLEASWWRLMAAIPLGVDGSQADLLFVACSQAEGDLHDHASVQVGDGVVRLGLRLRARFGSLL